MSKEWHVIPSPTDPDMFAVKCHYEYGELHPEYLVADMLPIEDATLIAAAPLMYEALKEVMEAIDKEYGPNPANFPKARAALQAAKGGDGETSV